MYMVVFAAFTTGAAFSRLLRNGGLLASYRNAAGVKDACRGVWTAKLTCEKLWMN